MGVYKISKNDTNYFSKLNTQLAECQEELSSFIGLDNRIENFQQQIELKRSKYSIDTRKVLCEFLKEQYAHLDHSLATKSIQLIGKENTFQF